MNFKTNEKIAFFKNNSNVKLRHIRKYSFLSVQNINNLLTEAELTILCKITKFQLFNL